MLMQWDPIGVAAEHLAADEYDEVIGPLIRQLRDGHSAEDLRAWLSRYVVDDLGLDRDDVRDRGLAMKLIDWWRNREADQC
jgi:hypothetical protein